MISWQSTFYILYGTLVYKLLYSFYSLTKESEKSEELYFAFADKEEMINKIENLYVLSKLIQIVNFSLCIMICFFFCRYMDSKLEYYIYYLLHSLIGLCLFHLIFSIISNSQYFQLNANENKDHLFYNSAFITSLITPLMTYLSNLTIICSANSGVCTQFYLSTLTSILGAFGITVSNLSEYLFPITIIMLIISNVSLYIKRRQLLHPPFMLGVFSTFLIVLSKLYEDKVWYLLYLGNILMLVAAIWNMKINKFFGLPKKSKI
jgi:hypothetical protein